MTIQWQLEPPQQSALPPLVQPNYLKEALFSHSPPHIAVETAASMKRIVVIGSSGSGKSTLARQLGAGLNLPVFHLDKYFWHPGWVGTPKEEWTTQVENLALGDSWIIDGNYRDTLDIRLKMADTIVFLDLPRLLCAWRVTKRRIQYRNRNRPDIAEGCRESVLDPAFPRFLRHILDYPNRARPNVLRKIEHFAPHKRFIWLRSTKEVQAFVEQPYQTSPDLNYNDRFYARLARFDG